LQDSSGMRICASSQPLERIGGVASLGTEILSLPPHTHTDVVATCSPSEVPSTGVHIFTSTPQMRQYGTQMRTMIHRAASGETEVLLDVPFSAPQRPTYETPAVLYPGDSLTTTCSYHNPTSEEVVGWGPDLRSEQCYNFLIVHPAGALQNGMPSMGLDNGTCLGQPH
jgi:hypothetical protein